MTTATTTDVGVLLAEYAQLIDRRATFIDRYNLARRDLEGAEYRLSLTKAYYVNAGPRQQRGPAQCVAVAQPR
jgi:hypothetical protein